MGNELGFQSRYIQHASNIINAISLSIDLGVSIAHAQCGVPHVRPDMHYDSIRDRWQRSHCCGDSETGGASVHAYPTTSFWPSVAATIASRLLTACMSQPSGLSSSHCCHSHATCTGAQSHRGNHLFFSNKRQAGAIAIVIYKAAAAVMSS